MYHADNSLYYSKRVPEGMNLKMVDDQDRLNYGVKPVLRSMCSDKVVLDLGCGTGILGLHALENGAKFVYFVEQNDFMVEILRNTLHKIIDPSKFKIIHKYAQDLTESDFDNGIPEICVSELWGILLFDEGYYQCTAPIKKIFKDLVFIPEIFHLDVFECDVDFDSLPWPEHEKQLIEHYKYTYARIGWTRSLVGKPVTFLNPKKIGEISYNANTGVFDNHITKEIYPTDGKMINLEGKVISGGIEEGGPKFGWYLYPSNKKVIIDIHIPKIEDANVYFSAKEELVCDFE
jgi:SAM-dependent methyltransferase